MLVRPLPGYFLSAGAAALTFALAASAVVRSTCIFSAGDHIDNLPTCGVFTAQFAIESWHELDWHSGRDAEFDYPKNHP